MDELSVKTFRLILSTHLRLLLKIAGRLSIILLCGLAGLSTSSFADEGNCAHASLRQCLMREHNKHWETHEIVSRFPKEYQGESPVPIFVLRDVASKLCLELNVVKLDPSKPTKEWESAILLLFASRVEGHFVMCKDVQPDRVVLVDSQSVPVERGISTRQLGVVWDGTALVVGRRHWLRLVESVVLSTIFATAIVVVFSWLRRKRAIATVAISGVLLCLQGCNARNEQAADRPIFFENDVIVLERQLLQDTPIQVPLVLRVSASASENVINSVSTSCKCLRIDSEALVGQVIGRSGALVVRVDVLPEDREVIGGDVILETEAGDIVSASITGIVTTKFSTSTPFIVASKFDTGGGSGLVRIFRFKEQGVPKSAPETRKFAAEGIQFVLQECDDNPYRVSPVGGNQVIEEHVWRYEFETMDVTNCEVSFDYPNPIRVEFAF